MLGVLKEGTLLKCSPHATLLGGKKMQVSQQGPEPWSP